MNNPKLREAIVKAFDRLGVQDLQQGLRPVGRLAGPAGSARLGRQHPESAQDMAAAKQLIAASRRACWHDPRLHRRRRPGLRGVRRHDPAVGPRPARAEAEGATPQWPIPATMMSKPSTAAHITLPEPEREHQRPERGDPGIVVLGDSPDKGGYNWSNYSNPQVDSDLTSFGKTSDATEQKTIITRTQQTIVADNTAVFASALQLTEPVARSGVTPSTMRCSTRTSCAGSTPGPPTDRTPYPPAPSRPRCRPPAGPVPRVAGRHHGHVPAVSRDTRGSGQGRRRPARRRGPGPGRVS